MQKTIILSVFWTLTTPLGLLKTNEVESVCYGQTHNGSVLNAAQLPQQGTNYKVFSRLAWYLGRTFVHTEVNQAIVSAFQQLAKSLPEKRFMYADTGWQSGGVFKPHKTHQNGLSVDFMVPVMNSLGESVYLPVGLKNRWGYDLEFNKSGVYETYTIDFVAMAEHLKLLHENAQAQGFSIKRVYFDPRLQPLLFATKHGQLIKNNIQFNQKQAWVRHDEHYHVDFDITCLSLKN